MAEDVAELALEAVNPIINHREVLQKAKSKAKNGLPGFFENAENPRRRVESDDEQTRHRDMDKRGSRDGKPNRRHSRYEDHSWPDDEIDLDYNTTNAPSNRRQSHRSSAGRPRIQRRASSLDAADFEKDRTRRRRRKDSQREDRRGREEKPASHGASYRLDGKDALVAGVAGIAAIYIASGFYKDHKDKDHKHKNTRRGSDAAS